MRGATFFGFLVGGNLPNIPTPVNIRYMADKTKPAPLGYWNYRVMEFTHIALGHTEVSRAIHEVHYEEDKPTSYSTEPAVVLWDAEEPGEWTPSEAVIKKMLSDIYTDEEAEVWYVSENDLLDGKSAKELVDNGQSGTVIQAINSLLSGAYL